MKRFKRLKNLAEYLDAFSISDPDLHALMTTAQADATSKLSRLSGVQLLAARPEERQTGDTDTFTATLSTAFFVVEKGLGALATPEKERDQFRRLLEVAGRVMEKVSDDATSGTCGLLSGLSIASVEIVPEASIFGGWLGYSIEINFE